MEGVWNYATGLGMPECFLTLIFFRGKRVWVVFVRRPVKKCKLRKRKVLLIK